MYMDRNNIIDPYVGFDFSGLTIAPPMNVSQGVYFTRLLFNNRSIFVQTPSSVSKSGFVKGKRTYIELMFTNSDSVFVNWLENLEAKCVNLLFENKDNLFQNDIDKDDIEGAFLPTMKIFKSGKYYVLKAFLKQDISIYHEQSTDNKLSMADISASSHIVSIIEIQGIKFTTKNFQLETEIKQSMVVSANPFQDDCFIKRTNDSSRKIETIENKMNDKKVDSMSDNVDVALEEMDEDKNKIIESDEVIEANEVHLEEEMSEENIDEENIDEEKKDEGIEEIDISNIGLDELNTNVVAIKTSSEIHMDAYYAAKEVAQKLRDEADEAFVNLSNMRDMYGITE